MSDNVIKFDNPFDSDKDRDDDARRHIFAALREELKDAQAELDVAEMPMLDPRDRAHALLAAQDAVIHAIMSVHTLIHMSMR